MNESLKAVCFDIGDVILPATRLRLAAVAQAAADLHAAELLGTEVDDFIRIYAEADARFEGIHINHLFSHPDIIAEAFRMAGVAKDEARVAAYLAAHRHAVEAGIRPDAELTALLDEIKAKGVRLAIISNGTREHQRLTLARMGITDYFEVITISEELGVAKPARYLFTHTLEQLGVAPGAALMVGDDLVNDISPAKLLGMRTALYLGHIPPPERLELFRTLIDVQASSFKELGRLLGE